MGCIYVFTGVQCYFSKVAVLSFVKMVINNAVLSCQAVKSHVTSFSELSLGHGEGVMRGGHLWNRVQ
jgi:hypothetical protein